MTAQPLTLATIPQEDPETYAMIAQRRYARHVPDREPGADGDAAAPEAAHILRPRHPGGDRAARPDPGRYGASLSAPARGARTGQLPHARAAPRSRQDARRAAVPGTGDAGRHPMRGLHAGRGRPAPPLHGNLQDDRRRQQVSRQAHHGHGVERLPAGTSRRIPSARSKASAPTAFPKAMRRASR